MLGASEMMRFGGAGKLNVFPTSSVAFICCAPPGLAPSASRQNPKTTAIELERIFKCIVSVLPGMKIYYTKERASPITVKTWGNLK